MRRLASLLAVLAVLATASATAAPAPAGPVRAYTEAHEREILGEFEGLLRLPNVASNLSDVQANADRLLGMLRARGLLARLLSAGPGTPPAIYAERLQPGARRTVVFYAHYDGQPVTPAQWRTPPFTPTLRDGLGPDAKTVDWRAAGQPLNGEWRLFARGAGDDKASIMALLAALDALKAAGRSPSVNVKIFLDGEEEQGSPHIERILRDNAALLRADLWLIGDGPLHQSRRMQLFFGARGVTAAELTVYGPLRALHSGHYGNWAPNPAVMAAELVAGMRDSEGRVLIPGFSDQVRPLTQQERQALAALPDVEAGLRRELALGRSEGGERLADSLMRPALNIRGLRAGEVGDSAANAIPTEARVSIDVRLVPDMTTAGVRRSLEGWLKARGWTVIAHAPSEAERASHPRLVRVQWEPGYPAHRTDMSLPASQAVTAAVSRAVGEPVLVAPMLGGSVPMYLFAELARTPVVGVPIANHDDNQHAANENLRLQNLWDGVGVYAALLSELTW